jgi:hypothetical protein
MRAAQALRAEWTNATRLGPELGVSLVLALVTTAAQAHSASDAYLTLSASNAPGHPTVHAQWDVALRDLDFVLGLDANGDGNITWGELRRRQPDIERYVMAGLHLSAAGKDCSVRPGPQQVDNHADGAYAVLRFDIDCGAAARSLTVDYSLFFRIDPSHRAIVVSRTGSDTATALLSPEHAKIELSLQVVR